MQIYQHDPQAVLDYSVDWSTWLGDDTIASATWAVPTGVSVLNDPAPAVIGKSAVAWLSTPGAAPGQRYTVTCHVVSAAGREDDSSFVLLIQDR